MSSKHRRKSSKSNILGADPNQIVDILFNDIDISDPKHRPKAKKREIEIQAKEIEKPDPFKCVNRWLFGEAPELHRIPSELSLARFENANILPNQAEKPKGCDDGSFPSDPVLKVLRSKLYLLEKATQQKCM